MCNGQCNGNCGKDKPKTVRELLEDLDSSIPNDKKSIMQDLADALDAENNVMLTSIHRTQQKHTELLQEIVKTQKSFWNNIEAF